VEQILRYWNLISCCYQNFPMCLLHCIGPSNSKSSFTGAGSCSRQGCWTWRWEESVTVR
jgi:hypothetical protein